MHAKPLHGLGVEKIDRRTIAIRLAEIEQNGPAAANRTRASLSAYFAWLLREGILETNPGVEHQQGGGDRRPLARADR